MNTDTHTHRDYSFVIGLAAGTVVGAGLAMWLAPRAAAELRERVTDSAKSFGEDASGRLHRAGARVAEAVGELKHAGQDVRDEVAGAVARGAREVERFATASAAPLR